MLAGLVLVIESRSVRRHNSAHRFVYSDIFNVSAFSSASNENFTAQSVSPVDDVDFYNFL
jgi:hypothetical protein